MRALAWIGLVLSLLVGCGDSDGPGGAFSDDVCAEVCSWPDECFALAGVSFEDVDCIVACEQSIDAVGELCLQTINDAVQCLGTCIEAEITDDDIVRCQEAAQAIGPACDPEASELLPGLGVRP